MAIGKKAMTSPARIKGIFFTKKITKRIALNKARKRVGATSKKSADAPKTTEPALSVVLIDE